MGRVEVAPLDTDPVTAAAIAARGGDAGAAARFVRATQADVWRLCASLVGRGDADDLTQETYLKAFQALPTFAGRSTVRTWLLSIARRTCVDALRERQRRPLLDRGDPADAPEPVAAGDVGEAVALRRMLARLDPDRREAFLLTQFLGLSYADAAEVCDCPVGTIRSRVARARDELVLGWTDERGTGS